MPWGLHSAVKLRLLARLRQVMCLKLKVPKPLPLDKHDGSFDEVGLAVAQGAEQGVLKHSSTHDILGKSPEVQSHDPKLWAKPRSEALGEAQAAASSRQKADRGCGHHRVLRVPQGVHPARPAWRLRWQVAVADLRQ